jgi:multidrug efflux pump subunit AcrA (membrane-fusion protein)
VWVLDPAKQRAALRPVTLGGYAADGSAIILSGLAEGETVVTAGAGQIAPDMPVIAWAGAAR